LYYHATYRFWAFSGIAGSSDFAMVKRGQAGAQMPTDDVAGGGGPARWRVRREEGVFQPAPRARVRCRWPTPAPTPSPTRSPTPLVTLPPTPHVADWTARAALRGLLTAAPTPVTVAPTPLPTVPAGAPVAMSFSVTVAGVDARAFDWSGAGALGAAAEAEAEAAQQQQQQQQQQQPTTPVPRSIERWGAHSWSQSDNNAFSAKLHARAAAKATAARAAAEAAAAQARRRFAAALALAIDHAGDAVGFAAARRSAEQEERRKAKAALLGGLPRGELPPDGGARLAPMAEAAARLEGAGRAAPRLGVRERARIAGLRAAAQPALTFGEVPPAAVRVVRAAPLWYKGGVTGKPWADKSKWISVGATLHVEVFMLPLASAFSPEAAAAASAAGLSVVPPPTPNPAAARYNRAPAGRPGALPPPPRVPRFSRRAVNDDPRGGWRLAEDPLRFLLAPQVSALNAEC
jgi:hypothetical protein